MGVTSSEREYMGRVAELSCCLCGAHSVEVHHIRAGQGMGQRASNYLTVPLCARCHRGPQGVHGDKSMLRIHKVTEMDLLAKTVERLVA